METRSGLPAYSSGLPLKHINQFYPDGYRFSDGKTKRQDYLSFVLPSFFITPDRKIPIPHPAEKHILLSLRQKRTVHPSSHLNSSFKGSAKFNLFSIFAGR